MDFAGAAICQPLEALRQDSPVRQRNSETFVEFSLCILTCSTALAVKLPLVYLQLGGAAMVILTTWWLSRNVVFGVGGLGKIVSRTVLPYVHAPNCVAFVHNDNAHMAKALGSG